MLYHVNTMSDLAARNRGVSSEHDYATEGGNVGMTASNITSMYINASDEHHHDHFAPPTSTTPTSESHTRSLVKGLTWRCLATISTVVIAWIVTGETGTAFQIGFFEFFAGLGAYDASYCTTVPQTETEEDGVLGREKGGKGGSKMTCTQGSCLQEL
ncbi:DUF2061 domain containing membrane protein [Nitzschia inconspicua]|uniref:DUF2061 domain containing membrane protein n=1 Tax=Nitzschia inconspicua TaxID=303405 RepID=A0A9K3PWK7_9STRA|nr:DUF2061 domain containing membrane protein [Nitzschia inconspicua]